MKRIVATFLSFLLLIILCSCGTDTPIESTNQTDTPTESTNQTDAPTETTNQTDAPTETTHKEEFLIDISNEQAHAVEKSAQWHAVLDYEYELGSITYTSIEDDGTYITVCGEVEFIDGNSNRYTGNYTVVLVEENKEENSYKVLSWELPNLVAILDESRDYYKELYDYIVQNGYFESKDKFSYFEKQVARNEYYYLIAEDNTIRFWDFASYENSSSSYYFSHECTFFTDADPYFEFGVGDFELRNGIAIDGYSVRLTGNIVNGEISLLSEKCVNKEAEDVFKYILEEQEIAKEFIDEILKEAMLGITFDQLFG